MFPLLDQTPNRRSLLLLTCEKCDNGVMASEVWEDIGGGVTAERRWPRAYNEGLAISRHCPPKPFGCGAEPYKLCTNPLTSRPRPMPCKARMRAARSYPDVKPRPAA